MKDSLIRKKMNQKKDIYKILVYKINIKNESKDYNITATDKISVKKS